MPLLEPDESELQRKRDGLAWKLRKFGEVNGKTDADDFNLDREKFNLEVRKFEREGRLWVRLGPVTVASLTTVIGALIALFGVLSKQDTAKTNNDAATYIRQNAPAVNASISSQIEQRAKILTGNSDSVAQEIFSRLVKQSDSAAAKQVWAQGLQVTKSSGGSLASAGGTVYVHYREPTKEGALSAVIAALTQAGYYVPGTQKVVQGTTGDVRYSADPSDKGTTEKAEAIASLVQVALRSVGVNLTIKPINIHATFPKAPATTFEVWLPEIPN